MPPSNLNLRLSLLAVLSVWMGEASALGLGELRSRSFLGEPFSAEVEVLTTGREAVDAGCFRLRLPQGDTDLPWLRRGSFNLRRGERLVLEIRSEVPLRDPVLQVGIAVGCGHEVQRDYTLFLSPRSRDAENPAPSASPPVTAQVPEVPSVARRRQSLQAEGEAPAPAPRLTPRRTERRAKPMGLPDRLVLSAGGDAVGEPSLRLATELMGWRDDGKAAGEAQRELLRLEYRMLAAMNEQATSQLAAAEKLRNMESTLAELQQRAGEFANRIEKGADSPSPVRESRPASPESTVATKNEAPQQSAASTPQAAKMGESSAQPGLFSEWSFYGAMLGAVLGIGGWLGWRQYRDRRERRMEIDEPVLATPAEPPRSTESDDFTDVDFHVGAAASDIGVQLDVPLDASEAIAESDVQEAQAVPLGAVFASSATDTPLAASGATVDEQFEVNPVMELAEIMLSFGRVKGAAQALQEYIDHNPEEALQPWIRLMDVYRMAGMREEFDRLAQDLNQHFNVEVQQWEPGPPVNLLDQPLEFTLDGEGGPGGAQAMVPKAMTLEDMEHIRNKLTECWGSAECLEYLNQLLRDNRGGKRSGFTLPVVEEILFLIELSETRKAMEKEAMNGEENV